MTSQNQSKVQPDLSALRPRPSIILASGSPRRKELMASLGLVFSVVPSAVDEEAVDLAGLSPAQIVCRLAEAKARDVAKKYPDALVIGSDTIVVLPALKKTKITPSETVEIFGKPKNVAHAERMLARLQNKTHQVYSGITLIHQGQAHSDYRKTDVTFYPMDTEVIARYVKTGEPMDKAGAYAIQGFGSLNVEKIDGCYFNVVGMSLPLLGQLFKHVGYDLF